MKIFVLSLKNPFANPSASSNRLLGLLRGLSKLDNDITVFVLGGYYSASEVVEYSDSGVKDNISYIYLSVRKNISIWQRRSAEYFFNYLSVFFLKKKLINYLGSTSESKIVWIENEHLSCRLVPKLRKFKNLKFFIEINEYPDIYRLNRSTRFFWQTVKAKYQVDYLFSHVIPELNGMALMTNSLIKYFESRINFSTKVIHLPMTVDLSRFDLSRTYNSVSGLNGFYICFLGSMNDAKDGVNILIEAFGSISSMFPEYKLALFGFWGYDSQNHLRRIKELGIQDRVIYSKAIDSDEVINLIMNSSVLVLPRPDSYQARGGFPTKLGEYLASSRPVIVTNVGEIPNYLKNLESCFMVEAGSVDSLKVGLMEVLANLDFAVKIGQEGRKVAERYFATTYQSERLNMFLKAL